VILFTAKFHYMVAPYTNKTGENFGITVRRN